ncbi:MAG: Cro/Cl family transcriptional regulator [Rhodospirillaceae bacterium]|nr:Cro/Cl family transcriptional regulator [Rhodospirillaceae bacterium]
MPRTVIRRTDTTDHDLGTQLRELRKARGMTLQGLAAEIGKTAGFLSQIERGQARPSLSTLDDLGKTLGVPFSWFSPREAKDAQHGVAAQIVRADNRRRLRYNDAVSGEGFVDDLLSPNLSGNLMSAHTRFAPGGGWGAYTIKKKYEVGIYILAGRLSVHHWGETHILDVGDHLQVAVTPDIPHHEIHNASETEEARFIWTAAPIVLDF